MWPQRNYLEDARTHEQVFRNILRSVGKNNEKLTLDEIYETYSIGNRYGRWTILDFNMGPIKDLLIDISENEAIFVSENIATLSGSGRVAKYKIKQDNFVEFDSNVTVWMS